MKTSETLGNIAAAMAQAQAEMPAVPFDAQNAFLKNKYATLGAMINTARPVLAKYGLSVVQGVVTDGAAVGVETIVLHASGEFIRSESAMIDIAEEKGKSRAQVMGSIVTYLRRYEWAALLGMYADEDTDGNGHHGDAQAQPQRPAQQPHSANNGAQRAAQRAGEAKASGKSLDEVQRLAHKCYGAQWRKVILEWQKCEHLEFTEQQAQDVIAAIREELDAQAYERAAVA